MNKLFDYILVGGGLQNGLILLALLARRPDSRVALVERNQVGGNHLWCFHAADIPPGLEAVVEPLVIRRWPGYSVRFSERERVLEEPYAAVSSERLRTRVHRAFGAHPGCQLFEGKSATRIGANRVELDDGSVLEGKAVIDARGPRLSSSVTGGFQKFLGIEFELSSPSGLTQPVLMDARVPQSDGFRFFYVLPLSDTSLLVEDTCFSDSPALDLEATRNAVIDYAIEQGFALKSVGREEVGVLPLPTRALEAAPPEAPLQAGFGGGWFHPTTGYSFPLAARLAEHVASVAPHQLFDEAFLNLRRAHQQQLRFALFLNRLLFEAVAPQDRHNVLERFYALPAETIRRFYAMTTTRTDRARVVCGRPPKGLSISRALVGGLSR